MDFEYSSKTVSMMDRLESFMQAHVLPVNQEFHETTARGEYPMQFAHRLTVVRYMFEDVAAINHIERSVRKLNAAYVHTDHRSRVVEISAQIT